MFKSKGIKRKLAEFLGRKLPIYKPRDGVVAASAFGNARSVLVCMPFDNDQFRNAVGWTESFKARYPHAALTLVIAKRFRSLATGIKTKAVVPLTEGDANFLKLPGKYLVLRIRRRKYDLAVDLNHGGTLFSSILCSISGAEVRIGFTGEWSDHFLNYSFTPRPRQDYAGNYNALINYLS